MSQNADVELLVVADDRTGAFETAAALADRGAGPVPVHAWPEHGAGSTRVVDLASRHLSPSEAAERAASVVAAGPTAHKIDSTLRGNWAEELVGRHRSGDRRVLLVPALPELGRTCVDGVVLEHGRPVHEGAAGTDVRRRVATSQPDQMLRAAGGGDVAGLATVAAVGEWLGNGLGQPLIAVADAADIDTIDAIVAAWAGCRDVVLAGTAVVIGAAAAALGEEVPAEPLPAVDGPILVACGSVHPAARTQIDEAEYRGTPISYIADDIAAKSLLDRGALILMTEIPVGDVTEPMAVAAAAALARGVADLTSQVDVAALVLIGGDTAAAVLGDRTATVHGSVASGTAWGTIDGDAMPIVARAGGFGSDRALVELLTNKLRPGRP